MEGHRAGHTRVYVLLTISSASDWASLGRAGDLRGSGLPSGGGQDAEVVPVCLVLTSAHPAQVLKLWFGLPSSSRSPMRFTLSLRSEAAAKITARPRPDRQTKCHSVREKTEGLSTQAGKVLCRNAQAH